MHGDKEKDKDKDNEFDGGTKRKDRQARRACGTKRKTKNEAIPCTRDDVGHDTCVNTNHNHSAHNSYYHSEEE